MASFAGSFSPKRRWKFLAQVDRRSSRALHRDVRKGEVAARPQVDEGELDRRIEMALEHTSHRFQKCRAQCLVQRAFGVWSGRRQADCQNQGCAAGQHAILRVPVNCAIATRNPSPVRVIPHEQRIATQGTRHGRPRFPKGTRMEHPPWLFFASFPSQSLRFRCRAWRWPAQKAAVTVAAVAMVTAGEGARMSAAPPAEESISAAITAVANTSADIAAGAGISADIAAGAEISPRRAGTRGAQSYVAPAAVAVGRISTGAAGSRRRRCTGGARCVRSGRSIVRQPGRGWIGAQSAPCAAGR